MKNKNLLLALGSIGIVYLAFVIGTGSSSLFSFGIPSNQESAVNSGGLVKEALAEAGSEEKYSYLKVQRSSSCGLQPATVEGYTDDQRIQGSCCSQMDLHRYQEQVEGLKKYSNLDVIPEDPYDILASLAKHLFDYQKNITLTVEQQAVYDKAMELSDEGGPCCCKCWRWYAFEGQAKHLITEYDWDAEEIATLWGLEDGCGGPGHEGGGH